MNGDHVYSVSELNSAIRNLLEQRFTFISVAGEVSNLRRPYSGHLYFTLKDDQGQLKAVLFKMQQRYLKRQPADGQAIICRGRLSVYEPRGEYQLIVDHIDFHGTGALQIAFEQLKKKLAAEGLFDQAAKKRLPPFPLHITLITSPRGAAVHDFIRIALRRFPQAALSVYPVAVQGDAASLEMVAALQEINEKLDTDVIVLCRGGGSMEDLQPFNEERLARAIYDSVIPVVSAVGHEIDFTIADFVSDLRAPTPSAAAELLLPDSHALKDKISVLTGRLYRVMHRQVDRAEDRLALQKHRLGDFSSPLANLLIRVDQQSMSLSRTMEQILAEYRSRISAIQLRLERQNPDIRLQIAGGRLSALHNKLIRAGRQCVADKTFQLQKQSSLLEAVSPLATLARGYAIVREKQTRTVITDSKTVMTGDRAEVLLHHGRLDVTVDFCHGEENIKKTCDG